MDGASNSGRPFPSTQIIKENKMSNKEERLGAVMDIMTYLEEPVFKNRYEVFYNDDIDSMVIVAKDHDSFTLLHMYAYFEDNPVPDDIQIIFNTPENEVIFFKGDEIDDLAFSLMEFLLVLSLFVA